MSAKQQGLFSFYGAANVPAEEFACLNGYVKYLAMRAARFLGDELIEDARRASWSRGTAAAHEAGHCVWYAANGVGVRRVWIRPDRSLRLPYEVWGGRAVPFRPVAEKCAPESPPDEAYGFCLDKIAGWAAEVVVVGRDSVVSSHEEIAVAALAMQNVSAHTGAPVGVLMTTALWQMTELIKRNRAAFDDLRRELAERRRLEAGRLRVLLAPVQPWTYRDAWHEAAAALGIPEHAAAGARQHPHSSVVSA